MRRSCPYCGRVHDVMYTCPKKKRRSEKKEYDYDKFRSTAAWQKKREEIKDRDMHLCQVCIRGLYNYGAPKYNSKDISVHHIIPLKDNFDLRDCNTNLISVCDCHHKMSEAGEIPAQELRDIAFEQEGLPPGDKFF